MGRYLNVPVKGFQESVQSEIYVDKSGVISLLNRMIDTEQKYVCVSRPRRFGKSMTVRMLSAYYNAEADSDGLFCHLVIAADPTYEEYRNRYEVILVNMQEFYCGNQNMDLMIRNLNSGICRELVKKYPDVEYTNAESLVETMYDIFLTANRTFIILIDEWDCVFRERDSREEDCRKYLGFLRSWMKDKPYISLAYMTGILPVKKYGTHSALNMFTEYSMTNPKKMAEFMGFTGAEVKKLCEKYQISLDEVNLWYDGYSFEGISSIYSPKSVVECLSNRVFDNYWNQTETFEALKVYIQMNYDGLKDKVVEMIAGNRIRINTGSFTNDMKTFHTADDVFTLLVHLGYLAYDFEKKEVYIPNKEVSNEFLNAVNVIGWSEVISAVEASEKLLCSLWEGDESAVAAGIEKAHQENASILQYNDENALSCTISIAFYAAREYYLVIREIPAGKGYADLLYLPRKKYPDKPAVMVELKCDRDACGAIAQIREKKYPSALDGYGGELMLAGIDYDRKTKKHTCKIEVCRIEKTDTAAEPI